jgi:hypothetical protein
MIIELSMCEADRETLGGPEWIPLDVDRLLDTPADQLIRWEAETGYPIERAISQIETGRPQAAATLVMLWLARKQGGDLAGGQTDDGLPEPYARLATVRTLRVSIRSGQGADVDPPARPSGD